MAAIKQEMIRLIKARSPSGLVVAVYVFGSSVRSDFKDSSDIDLAFLVDEQSYKKDPFEATAPAQMIAAGIGVALGRETDVLVLNSASLEMAYEIIATGFCLIEIDSDVRLECSTVTGDVGIRDVSYDMKVISMDLAVYQAGNGNPIWSALSQTTYDSGPIKQIKPFTKSVMKELAHAKLIR